jgi:membrane-bound lytic murein transglycosylase B
MGPLERKHRAKWPIHWKLTRWGVFVLLVLALGFGEYSYCNESGVPHRQMATQNPDVAEAAKQELIHKLSERFPEEEINAIFSDSRLEVDKSVIPPKKYRPAVSYYKSILTPVSVRDGKSYVEHYTSVLSGAQRKYGIPREVIAGILRIESNFGRNVGRRRVINSLYSLYILVPKRKDFALRELGAFISICRENSWDPYEVRGSPMGAFGFSQFLPSSYLVYAIDGDRDGTIDLFNSADAIYSTASYLHEFGWGKSRKSQIQALYAYNHEKEYVKTVLAYADRLRTKKKLRRAGGCW